MGVILCAFMDIDPNGPLASRFFVSSHLIITEEPLPNGLHYKPSSLCAAGPATLRTRERCGVEMNRIMKNLRADVVANRFTSVPTMDLYNQETWALDLRQIGFNFAAFNSSEYNPIDLTKRQAKHFQLKEMEDYAAEGRMLEWYDDLPARIEKKAQKQHPFYKTHGM
jgi:hypothetical protein